MSALFPHRAQVGSTDYGLDADTWDHRSRRTDAPELTATEDREVGKLYGPDGRSYRVVREERPRVPFGFHPAGAT